MKKHAKLIALICCLAFVQPMAGQVDSGNVTTFQGGTPALASEMNATINALITAINDNAQRIEALESATNPGTDLNGALFCLYYIDTVVGASNPGSSGNFIAVEAGVARELLAFTGPTTATITTIVEQFRGVVSGSPGLRDESEPLGTENVTYAKDENGVVTINGEGLDGDFKALLTPDGRFLIAIDTETETDSEGGGDSSDWFGASLNLAVRVENSAACNY